MKPRILSVARLSFPLASAIAALLSAPSASAANLYWDSDGTTPGSGAATGTWGTSAFWSTDSTGASSTAATATTGVDDLFFSAGTTGTGGTITVNASQTARLLTLEEGGLTFSGGTLITLAGGGGITVASGAGNAVVSTALTVNGNNTFNVGTGRTLTLNTGAFTRGTRATLNIQGAGTVTSTQTGLATGGMVNGIIGPWASFGTGASTKYATFSGNNIVGLTGTAAATAAAVTSTAGTVNYDVAAVGTLGAGASINTLRYTGAAGTIAGGLTTKGIMNVGGGSLLFSGAVTSGASGTEMVLNTANGSIGMTGASGLLTGAITKVGSGTFTLGNGAAHSIGSIVVNEGTFISGHLNADGLAGAVTINSGGTLKFGSTNKHGNTALFTVNSGGIFDLNGQSDTIGAITGAGSVTNTGASATLSFASATQTFSGVISGNMGITTSNATSIMTLSGANTFTGTTNVNVGTIILANTNALGTNPGVNGTSGISIASTGILQAGIAGLTVAAPITLSGVGNATIRAGVTAGSTSTFNGAIGGTTGNLVFTTTTGSFNNASSIFVLGAASNYTGNTLITTGNGGNNPVIVRAGAGIVNALPATTVLSFGQVVGGGSGRALQYDLNGNNQTLAGLDNGGVVPSGRNMSVTSSTAATLTINNTGDYTFGGANTNPLSGTARGQISGAIALTKNGAGTFTLGGTLANGTTAGGNTFTGNTTILGGILVLGESLSIQNSTFDTTTSITGTGTAGLRAGIGGTGVTTLTLGGLSGNKNFSDVFTTTSGGYSGLTDLTLNPGNGATPSYSGDIGNGAGALTLTKTGVGTQTLTGANTYSGGTIVNQGTLTIGAGGTLGTSTGALTVANNNSTAAGTDTILNLAAGVDTTVGSLSGTIATPLSGTNTATINNGGSGTNFTVNQTAAGTYAGVIAGDGGFTLGAASTNTLTLTGISTYLGNTTISGGTLAVNGSLSNSTVNLNSGTLTGSGSVATAVNVGAGTGGILSNNSGVAGASLTIGSLTFNGAATVNTFANGASAPIVTTNLATNGAGLVTINASSTAWINGDNHLISYTGSIGGAGFGQFSLGTVTGLSGRQTVGGLINLSGTAVALTITGDNTVWSGANGGNWITDTTGSPTSGTPNWALKTGLTATDFWATDNVEFNDTYNLGAGPVTVTQTAVDISAADVSPTSTLFNNSSVNYTLGSTGGFGIASGSLTKSGTGTLTITNANTYIGGTNLNAGTIQIDNAGALGASGTIAFGGGTLKYGTGITTDLSGRFSTAASQAYKIDTNGNPLTFATALTSAGGTLTKEGANTLTLTTTNTYTGSTVINGGTLQLGSGTTTGALTGTSGISGSGNLAINRSNAFTQAVDLNGAVISGAGLSLTHSGTSTVTLSGNNSYGGGTSITGTNAIISVTTDADALGSGDVTIAGGRRLAIAAGLDVANNIIIGTNSAEGSRGVLESSGTGTATLSGNITINNSSIAGGHFASSAGNDLVLSGIITSSVVVTQRLGTVTYSGGGTGYTNLGISGTAKVGALNGIATTATVDLGPSAAGTLDLNGFNQSLVGIVKSTNAAIIGNSSTVNDSMLTITGTSTYAGVIQNAIGSGTKTVALTVNGGTLSLTGINTYSGGTTVGGNGTLTATINAATALNALGTGAVDVGAGSTLVLDNTKITNITDTIANTFTGAGLLKLQFAANTTARNTSLSNVTGFAGTIQLSSLGTTNDKWVASSLGTAAASLIVDSGNTVYVGSGTTSFTGGMTINGAGNTDNRGAIRVAGAASVLGGNIILASSSAISMENVAAQITGNITTGAIGTHTLTLGGTGSTGGILGGNISDGTGTLTVTQALGSYTLSGNLSHSGGVNVTGSGVLTLSGTANTYTGATALSGGTGRSLLVTANGALGAIGTGNETTIASGGQLGFSGGINYSSTEKIVGSGAGNSAAQGVFTNLQRGFIQSVSGNNTFAGDIEINAGGISRIGTQDGAQLTLTGAITQAAGNILFRTGSNAGDFVTLSNSGNSFGGDSQVFNAATVGNYAGVRLGVSNALPTNLTITSFSGTGAGTALDLNGKNQILNGLITGSGAGGLNIINMDTVTPSTLTLDPTADKSTTNTLILGDGGLGTINLVKDGAFTQTLSGLNSFTGSVTVNDGTLAAGVAGSGGNSAFGSVSNSRTITVNTGGTLSFNVGNVFNNNFGSAANTLPVLNIAGGTLTNGGTATNSALGDITLTGGTLNAASGTGSSSGYGVWNLNGTVTSSGTSTLSSSSSHPVTLSASSANGFITTFDVQSGTLTASAALGEVTATGDEKISGLTKTGAGTMILSGTNTYTGNTTVSAGVLAVNGSLANTSTSVAGTLKGSGTIGGSVTIQSGGTLAPGNSIESLGVASVDFLAGSTYAYELDSNTLNGDLAYSTGTLDIASGIGPAGTTLTLTELFSGVLAVGSKLTLISYTGGWTSTELFNYLGNTLQDDSIFTLGSNQWLFNYNDTSGGSNFLGDQVGAGGFVTMTVIPEPNVAALLGGLGVLALFRRRRN